MTSTRSGIHSVELQVDVYPTKPTIEDKKNRRFNYLGQVSLSLYNQESEKICELYYYYTVKFNKVNITKTVNGNDKDILYNLIRQEIAKLLRMPPANFYIRQTSIAWPEDELWAAAHDWEQTHRWVIYCPGESTYLNKEGNFSGIVDAVWLEYDEAVVKRNNLLSMAPKEILDVIPRSLQ